MHLSKHFHLPTPQHGAGWPFSERAQKEALTAPKGLLRAPKGFKETPALQVGFISPVFCCLKVKCSWSTVGQTSREGELLNPGIIWSWGKATEYLQGEEGQPVPLGTVPPKLPMQAGCSAVSTGLHALLGYKTVVQQTYPPLHFFQHSPTSSTPPRWSTQRGSLSHGSVWVQTW